MRACAQDVAAGDGTTSVTVICGALLRKCLELLERGVHPTVISDSFAKAAAKAEEILQGVAVPVDLKDRESLIKAANTCATSFNPSALCTLHCRPGRESNLIKQVIEVVSAWR